MEAVVSVGQLDITCNCDIISYFPIEFRYVAIPTGMVSTTQVDLTDYRAVMQAFNIQE